MRDVRTDCSSGGGTFISIKIRKVVPSQFLAAQVRMYTAQAAEPIAGDPHALEIRQLNLARIAHNHKLNITLAINKDANLSASFVRQFANLASKLGRYNLVRWNAALVEFFDPPQLVWLKTLRVTVKTFHSVDWQNYNMASCRNRLR